MTPTEVKEPSEDPEEALIDIEDPEQDPEEDTEDDPEADEDADFELPGPPDLEDRVTAPLPSPEERATAPLPVLDLDEAAVEPAFSLQTATAEECFAEGQRLGRDGNHRMAAQWMQVAVAKAPANPHYRAALRGLHAQRGADAKQREATVQAAQQAVETPTAPAPRASASKAHLVKAGVAAGLLLLAGLNAAWMFGVFDAPPDRPEVDAMPYMTLSLVVSGAAQGPNPTDLVLRVGEDWDDAADKEALVGRLAAAAAANGYTAITVMRGDRKVASARNGGKLVLVY